LYIGNISQTKHKGGFSEWIRLTHFGSLVYTHFFKAYFILLAETVAEIDRLHALIERAHFSEKSIVVERIKRLVKIVASAGASNSTSLTASASLAIKLGRLLSVMRIHIGIGRLFVQAGQNTGNLSNQYFEHLLIYTF
jgi:hypothetical protein